MIQNNKKSDNGLLKLMNNAERNVKFFFFSHFRYRPLFKDSDSFEVFISSIFEKKKLWGNKYLALFYKAKMQFHR